MDKKMNWKESKTKKMHNVNKQHEKGEGQMRIEGVDRKKGCKKKKEAGRRRSGGGKLTYIRMYSIWYFNNNILTVSNTLWII